MNTTKTPIGIFYTRGWVASFLVAFALTAIVIPASRGDEAAPAPVDLTSPRSALNSFTDAMTALRANDESRLVDALKCLYLDEIPEGQRATRGAELANQLYDVLEKAGVKLDSIPEKPEGRSIAIDLPNDSTHKIVLRQYDDNLWRFSYDQTLKVVDQIEAAVSEQPQAAPPAEELDPQLKSPRDAMAAFINGMNTWRQGGMEKATSALDLSAISKNVRAQMGRELAVMLKRVLDRDRKVQIADIPSYSAGDPYVHLLAPAGNIVIDSVLDPDTGLRTWKFTAKTIENLPGLYDTYKDRPLAQGISRDSTPTLLSMSIRDAIDRRAPVLLRRSFYLENWQWFGMLATVVASIVLGRIVARCAAIIARRMSSRRNFEIRAESVDGLQRAIRLAITAWGWLFGLSLLGLPSRAYVVLDAAAQLVTVVSIIWALFRITDIIQAYLLDKAKGKSSRFDDLFVPLLARCFKLVFVVAGFVAIADALDIDYMSLLAGLGLGGLAIALAAKDTLSNVFGSLTILFDRPFQIGDWVKVRDIEGLVEHVGMRSTRIRTFYESVVSVPNSEVITATVDNYGARRYRRIRTIVSIAYDTPPDKIEIFCEGIRQIIASQPSIRQDEYYVHLNELGPHSLDILVYCFLDVKVWGTELRERERLFLDIIRLAEKHGIEFAFPTQTLYLRGGNGNGHADGLSSVTEPNARAAQKAHAQ
ncbi:MAG: mechanosensitive ion channel family protein [Candidatus Hydrogenedentes bacterium]|nr:mechanosensitive ion channel family protein [Candidatus Hydrogenedentota bacterium]